MFSGIIRVVSRIHETAGGMLIMGVILSINEFLHGIAWGPFTIVLLLGLGVYLTARLRGIQFSCLWASMKTVFGGLGGKKRKRAQKGSVTPFQALATALAGCVGTGNIAGVASAIVIGGTGAVFWMWASAFVGMAVKYAEVFLSVRYRCKNDAGEMTGGPMHYMMRGLGKKGRGLACLFAGLGAIAAFGSGNMVQSNALTDAVTRTVMTYTALFDNELTCKLLVGAVVAVVSAIVVLGGVKRIGSVAGVLVPVMSLAYTLTAVGVICVNYYNIPDALGGIIKNAFGFMPMLGGVTGFTLTRAFRTGVARGIFSNEAGLGSAPMAHACADTKDPVRQGLYGIAEVFIDTIVMCTITALALLCSGVKIPFGQADISGTELMSGAFSTLLSEKASNLLIMACMVLFGFSTILCWALYGTRCAEFLFGERARRPYQFIYIAVVIVGAVMRLDLAWSVAETVNGFMSIPNLIAVLLLSPTVIRETRARDPRDMV